MDVFAQVVERIIKEQESVIGPLALEQAKKVDGLSFSKSGISVEGNKVKVIEDLVEQYQHIFGRASLEVCRDAARPLMSKLPANEIPSLLK